MGEQPHNSSVLKIAQALTEAAAQLRAAGINDARLDARLLLCDTLARDHAYLIAHSEAEIDPAARARFRERVARRAAGEPLQYITGRQEFYGLEFEVNPSVLIPRPETELLVELAVKLLHETNAPRAFCDVGTGSGCIPVALLHEIGAARAFALDISPDALAVAARNAERHGVRDRLTLLLSDCFDALEHAPDARFPLITSNPPYIAEREIPHLQREVREHEPRLALTPGGDGLAVIRRLIGDAPRFLVPGGHLLVEIGHDQQEAVAALVDRAVWETFRIHPDLQGIPRIVALRRGARGR